MTALTTVSRPARITDDLSLVGRQAYYEQLAFWRNPISAVFTVGFSVIFLILLAASSTNSKISFYSNLSLIQYYVPGFVAYGVMSVCFNNLGIIVVVRRETGLLKRQRLAPIPNWVMFAGLFTNAIIVSLVQIVLLLLVGRFAYHVHLPTSWLPIVVALVVGVFCFTSLGVAMSTLIPNQESAGPLLSIVFFVLLFLSGLWFPLNPGSGLAKISNYFPLRHFILATFQPFNHTAGASPWAWHDVLVMAIWGALAVVVAIRRFRWEPRKT